jgi:hypothetical protein
MWNTPPDRRFVSLRACVYARLAPACLCGLGVHVSTDSGRWHTYAHFFSLQWRLSAQLSFFLYTV